MTPADVARLLPHVYRAGLVPGSPLLALCSLMARYATPVEEGLVQLDRTFAPYLAPEAFVPYLARWVDMEQALTTKLRGPDGELETLSSGHGRLRELVAQAAELSRLRGTGEGMRRILEIATGCRGFAIVETEDRPFHFHIEAPPEAERHRLLVDHVAALEKPAYVTYSVSYETTTEQDDDPVAA